MKGPGHAGTLRDKLDLSDMESNRSGNYCEFRNYGSSFLARRKALDYTSLHGGATITWFCRKCDAWHLQNEDRTETCFHVIPKGKLRAGRCGTTLLRDLYR